jgi:hypothetical protein
MDNKAPPVNCIQRNALTGVPHALLQLKHADWGPTKYFIPIQTFFITACACHCAYIHAHSCQAGDGGWRGSQCTGKGVGAVDDCQTRCAMQHMVRKRKNLGPPCGHLV